jgi:hypothetical protein
LQQSIKNGEIRNLEKAALIAKAKTDAQRERLLKCCLDGASLKQLKHESSQQKKIEDIQPHSILHQKKRPGKQASKINLGSTTNKHIISKLIKLVLNDPLYARFKDQFDHMLCDDYGTCSTAFSSLIKIMEKVETN